MSNDLESMAQSLAEEALTEAASTFFGTRRSLEKSIEAFHEYVLKLQEKRAQVLKQAGLLNALLFKDEHVDGFFAALGVAGHGLADLKSAAAAPEKLPKPAWSFGAEGRYVKLVSAVYAELHMELEEYLHGKWTADENNPRKKVLTENWNTARELCTVINKEIDRVNTSIRPSQTLSFVRSLNVMEMEKSEAAGGTLPTYNGDLDRELAFESLDCEALVGSLALPETPKPAEVKQHLVKFAKGLYLQEKSEIQSLLALLKKRKNK